MCARWSKLFLPLSLVDKCRTLDIAPLGEGTPPQEYSRMARVVGGFHSFNCTPTRSFTNGMNHTCLCLPNILWVLLNTSILFLSVCLSVCSLITREQLRRSPPDFQGCPRSLWDGCRHTKNFEGEAWRKKLVFLRFQGLYRLSSDACSLAVLDNVVIGA